jgi:hypothetical protein
MFLLRSKSINWAYLCSREVRGTLFSFRLLVKKIVWPWIVAEFIESV